MAYDDAQQASWYSCGLVLDSRACALARAPNDANVLVMPARFIEPEIALEIVDMFLSTYLKADAMSAGLPRFLFLEVINQIKESSLKKCGRIVASAFLIPCVFFLMAYSSFELCGASSERVK